MKKVSIGAKPQPVQGIDADPDEWVKCRQVSESEKMKRLTIDVPEGLHRRIKTSCAQEGLKMADEIRALLEERFNEQ